MKPVLAFDLNGTLLDTSVLDGFFNLKMGDKRVRHEWFLETIGLTNVATITGYFEPFPTLAIAALHSVGKRYGAHIDEAAETEFKDMMKTFRAFEDVRPALEKLHDAKFRTVVLTNSPEETAKTLLDANDLLGEFEMVLSAEKSKKFKPDECVYRGAAQALGVAPGEMMLVAAHAWDTTGALRAGCHAAFIERPGESLPPNAPKPPIIAKDLKELADKVCASAS